jgi:hypothetical protein
MSYRDGMEIHKKRIWKVTVAQLAIISLHFIEENKTNQGNFKCGKEPQVLSG